MVAASIQPKAIAKTHIAMQDAWRLLLSI